MAWPPNLISQYAGRFVSGRGVGVRRETANRLLAEVAVFVEAVCFGSEFYNWAIAFAASLEPRENVIFCN